MARLAISSIRLIRASIPLTLVHAGSMHVSQKTERTIVEMALENGVTGLGETWGTPDAYALAQRFARDLIGKDAIDRNAIFPSSDSPASARSRSARPPRRPSPS